MIVNRKLVSAKAEHDREPEPRVREPEPRVRNKPGSTLPPGKAATVLADEIQSLRQGARLLQAMLAQSETLEETASALGALGLAYTRLAGLLKANQELGGVDQLASALAGALSELFPDLGAEPDSGRTNSARTSSARTRPAQSAPPGGEEGDV